MEEQAAAGVGIVVMLIYVAIILLCIASSWILFSKAGKPGWASIVPIWNLIVLAQVAGKPGWWAVLMMIPIVGMVIWILVAIGLAERFGKGAGFGIGVAFLSMIFLPILAFSDATYREPTPGAA